MFVELTEALATMRRRDERGRHVPFSLEVTTCDEERKTGGQNLVLQQWVLHEPKHGQADLGALQRPRRTADPKPVDEYASDMRRVRNPINNEIRQICIRLITSFNGQTVIW